MFANFSPELFNLIEGSFWVTLGLICVVVYFKTIKPYKTLALFSVLILIPFGASDFFEAYYGSFLVSGMEWLFIWKIADVFGLCVIFIWYLFLRIRK